MSQVIEILKSLGIDTTVYYQFGIFCVAFLSMKYIVFKPYLKTYDERVKRTVGGQQEAEILLEKAAETEMLYSEKAKKLNGEIKQIFAEQNAKAKKEVEQVMAVAKKEAEAQTEESRKEIENSVSMARKEMENHIQNISKNIQKKFVEN